VFHHGKTDGLHGAHLTYPAGYRLNRFVGRPMVPCNDRPTGQQGSGVAGSQYVSVAIGHKMKGRARIELLRIGLGIAAVADFYLVREAHFGCKRILQTWIGCFECSPSPGRTVAVECNRTLRPGTDLYDR